MNDKNNVKNELLTGNIVQTMLSLSIPAILGMVVIGLYNFMDAAFVGNMVGPEAMTAVKVSYPFTLLALVFYLPIMIAPNAMLSMFITDSAIVAEGAPMLRVLFTSYITYGVLILAITFFQAIGKGGAAAAVTLLRQVVLFLPLVVLLPKVFERSVEGVFYAQLITDVVVLILGIILMAKEFRAMRKEERAKCVKKINQAKISESTCI